jgi:hypothetical protein
MKLLTTVKGFIVQPQTIIVCYVAFTLTKFYMKMAAMARVALLALAILGNVTQIGLVLFVLCHPEEANRRNHETES